MPKMRCKTCNGTSFVTEVGKQLCATCGQECDGYIQLENDDEDMIWSSQTAKLTSLRVLDMTNKEERERNKQEAEKLKDWEDSSSWTTCEVYSIVLQKWTHILVEFGASKELPKLVLKLWAAYLNKLQMAFFTDNGDGKLPVPRLGLIPNRRDVGLLHDNTDAVSHKSLSSRSSMSSKSSKSNQSVSEKKLKKVLRKQEKFNARNAKLSSSFIANKMSEVLLDIDIKSRHSSESSNREQQEEEEEKNLYENVEMDLKKHKVSRSKFVERWLLKDKDIYAAHESDGEEGDVQGDGGDVQGDGGDVQVSVDGERVGNDGNCDNVSQQSITIKAGQVIFDEGSGEEVRGKVQEPPSKRRKVVEDITDTKRRKVEDITDTKRRKVEIITDTKRRKVENITDTKRRKVENITDMWWNAESDRKVTRGIAYKFKKFEIFQPSFRVLLSILYVSCRLQKEKFLLMDLIRWTCNGDLPYLTAHHLIPTDMKLSYNDLNTFLKDTKFLPTHQDIRIFSGKMCLFLNLKTIKLPDLEEVIAKMLRYLCLPDDMLSICLNIAKSYSYHKRAMEHLYFSFPEVEINAAASIITALKVMWGVDGRQERYLSSQVEVINRELQHLGSDMRLFSWHAWHQHIHQLLWFNEKLNPNLMLRSKNPHTSFGYDRKPYNSGLCPKRLVHYLKTEGVWRRSKTTRPKADDNMADLISSIADGDMSKGFNESYLLSTTHSPLVGYAESYLNNWQRDQGKDRDTMKKVAEKVVSTSFSDHFSTFIRDIEVVQRELKVRRSSVKVHLSSKTCLNVRNDKNWIVLADPSEAMAFHDSFFDEKADKDVKGYNMYQQWLVKLLAKVCLTTTADIVSCQTVQESKLIPGKRRSKTKNFSGSVVRPELVDSLIETF